MFPNNRWHLLRDAMWPIKSTFVKFWRSPFNISYAYFIHTTNRSTCSVSRRFRHGRRLSCNCQGRSRRVTKRAWNYRVLKNCQALLIYLLEFKPCIMCPSCSAARYDVCRWGKNQFTKSRRVEQLHVYPIKKLWYGIDFKWKRKYGCVETNMQLAFICCFVLLPLRQI